MFYLFKEKDQKIYYAYFLEGKLKWTDLREKADKFEKEEAMNLANSNYADLWPSSITNSPTLCF